MAEILARELSPRERAAYQQALDGHIAGTPTQAAAALGALMRRTGADEFLVTTSTYDRTALLDSYRLLAQAVGLAQDLT